MQSAGDTLYLGIDGGGTRCRSRVVNSRNELLGTGIAGPANPFQNLQQARNSIVEAAKMAVTAAGLEPGCLAQLVAGVGIAGVNVPHAYQLMSAWQHPFGRMYLTTDTHIACLGAHGDRDGAVLVVGTGSVGYAIAGDSVLSLGGHGFPFGDTGSGAWLGFEAMRAALLAMDALGPATALVAALEHELGANRLGIIDAMAGARSRDYARLAPAVFGVADAGDPVAVAIVSRGRDYLDDLARRLLQTGVGRLSLLGGLSAQYASRLSLDVVASLHPAAGEPDAGAVRYAMLRHAQPAASERTPAAV
jgi:glucosamine kinase